MLFNDDSELERLRRQIQEVTAERDKLLAENRRLHRGDPTGSQDQAGVSPPPATTRHGSLSVASKPTTGSGAINHESPVAERVKLFRSLFHGRDDVFAKAWWSQKTQRVGYSPVCKHQWDPALCDKPRVKCADCPNRDFNPIADGVIQDHLEGKHTIGIYPLLPDETCHLLAIDFDKRSWMDDVGAFLETCRQMDIPAVLERSRSGNGAHVWIFFSESVAASTARKLECYLLTETMSRRHQLGMDSYDRLFPNQDTLPKGGFGNLILNDVLQALEEGRSPILLTDRREHLEFFTSRLAKSGHKVVVLRGGMGALVMIPTRKLGSA